MPIWSSPDANATRPQRLTRPYVGLSPTTPQNAAGCRTEPPVSVPSAPAARPPATAAAEPPDEPPGTRAGSHGFRVSLKAECSVDEPIANSSMLVLPRSTAPAARRRSTTVASYGGTKLSRIFEPHVVGTPRVQRMSFRATGTPSRAERGAPAR